MEGRQSLMYKLRSFLPTGTPLSIEKTVCEAKNFMKISEEKKLDVLLTQLRDRYDALDRMRDRSMQFVLWILGLGLGIAWLLISKTVLTCIQQWAFTVLLILLGIGTFLFVYAIERGFQSNRQVTIRLETALKLYEQGFYGISDSVLPVEFSRQKVKWTGHFKTLYAIIFTVFISLIVLTWANICKPESSKAVEQFAPNQIQKQTIPNGE